jgi:hypothetical protein
MQSTHASSTTQSIRVPRSQPWGHGRFELLRQCYLDRHDQAEILSELIPVSAVQLGDPCCDVSNGPCISTVGV